jgi:hypothetical protein
VLIELLVAAAVTALPTGLPPLDPVPPPDVGKLLQHEQRLPNGGRACMILTRCNPSPCIRPAQQPRRLAPARCGPRGRTPAPRMIPARG